MSEKPKPQPVTTYDEAILAADQIWEARRCKAEAEATDRELSEQLRPYLEERQRAGVPFFLEDRGVKVELGEPGQRAYLVRGKEEAAVDAGYAEYRPVRGSLRFKGIIRPDTELD